MNGMEQGRVPQAGSGEGAGERVDLQGRAVPVPEAAATAYGGVTGAGGLVLLAKPLPSRAGYYAPFVVVRLQDLPEELRRQVAVGGGQGAAAAAATALRGEGAALARHLQLLYAAHHVVPEGLSRQAAALVSETNGDPAVKFAVDDDIDANYERRVLLLKEECGKLVYLDASRLQVLDGKEDGLFERGKELVHAWMEQFGGNENSESSNMAALHAADAEMGAFQGNGLTAREHAAPIVALLLHKNNAADAEMGAFYDSGLPARENAAFLLDYSNGLVILREDAVPLLLGSNRAVEKSTHHYDDVFVPSAESLMSAGEVPLLAPRSTKYSVQVSVDAAAGAKAGDPIAAGVEAAAGADAGHEHGSLSAVAGIVAASSAATALAAGAVGPVTAFGLFAVLVGGLSLAMASVRAP